MTAKTITPTLMPARELEEEKPGESPPRIRCPLCGWSPRKGQMVLRMRQRVEHIRFGRCLPSLPPPVERDAVSLMQPMVAAF
jgi:hypothetical protein